jgi:hypothetical protein
VRREYERASREKIDHKIYASMMMMAIKQSQNYDYIANTSSADGIFNNITLQ